MARVLLPRPRASKCWHVARQFVFTSLETANKKTFTKQECGETLCCEDYAPHLEQQPHPPPWKSAEQG